VLAHYKGLLDVEEAFCELKSYPNFPEFFKKANKNAIT
jgi:hypothetical protein